MNAVTAVTTCCGELRQSLYKMQRNTYATGDPGQPKSLSYVMDCAPARIHGCEI
jgi:hypothetical protein